MTRRANPAKEFVHCINCGTPLDTSFRDALQFDVEFLLCRECDPPPKRPRVTLYGAPDGQEMGRWTK